MKILLFLIAMFVTLMITVGRALGWTDLDPSTCTTFYTSTMVPEYESPGSKQWGIKVMKNVGYNKNRQDEAQYEKGWINESFTDTQEKDFDTGRAWANYGIITVVDPTATYYDADAKDYRERTVRFMILTTSYQYVYEWDPVVGGDFIFEIKALGSGGFRIKNSSGATRTLLMGITKQLVLFTGS